MTGASQFYSDEELDALGFAACGSHVRIHKQCNIVDPSNLALGSHVRIDGYTVIASSGPVEIGSYVHIGSFCYISGGGGVILEDFCGLSQGTKLYSTSDDYSGATLTNPTVPAEYTNVKRAPVHLKRHVIVGSNSVVLPGTEIGEGAAVGALSLVSGILPGWAIYAGTPARKVKNRSMDLLKHEEALRGYGQLTNATPG
jgi:acetyltransferase-like isoleucine patch superfamily enzyme